ncbi:MAG: sulfite oxidase [Gemmatimonadota bacterium]
MDSALRIIESDPLNAELPIEMLHAEPRPGEPCYVRNHFGVPKTDSASWRLRLAGLVDRPRDLTLAQLQELPSRTLTMTLECAGNGRALMSPPVPGTPWGLGAVSRTTFTGAPLSALLRTIRPKGGARELVFIGLDRGEVAPGRVEAYARGMLLDDARSGDALLAWEQNGAPLEPEHGAPLRLVVPGWYGMASVKWLAEIRLSDEPFRGYYQGDRYVYVGETGTPDGTPVGRIRVRSLITSPTHGQELASGSQVTVRGVAWAGSEPVSVVEISTDGGATWDDAELDAVPAARPASGRDTRWAPRRWRHEWRVSASGRHELVARARDAAGDVQPLASRWNAFGYGNNVVQRVTVHAVAG